MPPSPSGYTNDDPGRVTPHDKATATQMKNGPDRIIQSLHGHTSDGPDRTQTNTSGKPDDGPDRTKEFSEATARQTDGSLNRIPLGSCATSSLATQPGTLMPLSGASDEQRARIRRVRFSLTSAPPPPPGSPPATTPPRPRSPLPPPSPPPAFSRSSTGQPGADAGDPARALAEMQRAGLAHKRHPPTLSTSRTSDTGAGALSAADRAAAAPPAVSDLVVNIGKSHAEYDCYVGRTCRSAPPGSSGGWGNPFKVDRGLRGAQRHTAHLAAVSDYRNWLLLTQPDLVRVARKQLKGKKLACWCLPLPCHATELAAVANSTRTQLTHARARATGACSAAEVRRLRTVQRPHGNLTCGSCYEPQAAPPPRLRPFATFVAPDEVLDSIPQFRDPPHWSPPPADSAKLVICRHGAAHVAGSISEAATDAITADGARLCYHCAPALSTWWQQLAHPEEHTLQRTAKLRGGAPPGAPTAAPLNLHTPTTGDTIAIVPVHIHPCEPDPLTGQSPPPLLYAFVPRQGGVFGAPEPEHARSGRREAAVEIASKWLPHVGFRPEACFLAGEVDAFGNGFGATEERTSVVAAPLFGRLADDVSRAATPHELAAVCATSGGTDGIWATLDALAPVTDALPDAAQFRIAAVALARVDSYIRPTKDGPAFMRVGVRPAAAANATSSTPPQTADTAGQAVTDADAACTALKEALLAQQDDGLPGFAEFCHGLADNVRTLADCMPGICKDIPVPSLPPAVVNGTPYTHKAQILPTDPLPPGEAPQHPPHGWWPYSVRDIIKPWALRLIEKWFQDMNAWHRAGGPSHSRPASLAIGPDGVYAKARNYPWDLRGGDGNIRMWGDGSAPRATTLNLSFAAEVFKDTADREVVSMILGGVRFKVDAQEIAPDKRLQPYIVLQPNLLSMYLDGNADAAAQQVQDMVEQGWVQLFSSTDIISCPFIISPGGVVSKAGTTEKRGIRDRGAPRKRLRTVRSGLEVESSNVVTRRAFWNHEDKPTLQDAAGNGALARELGILNEEPTFEIALDYSKYFHRLDYADSEVWQMGSYMPGYDTRGEKAHDACSQGVDLVMTMGATPASQIAQRFGSAKNGILFKAMDAEESARWATAGNTDLTPACKAALEARSSLPHDSFGTMARLFDIIQYTDDERLVVVGVDRTIRILRHHWRLIGPPGLNVPLSRPAKQQLGACVTWLGGCTAASVGLVWLPQDKALRVARDLATTLAGGMQVGVYRSLVGFLASILFMVGNDQTLLHHIFRPVTPGNEIDGGPAELVSVDQLMRPVLERWLHLVVNVSGCAASAALAPATTARREAGTQGEAAVCSWRIRADAALQGCPSPGIGGWLYGFWWAIAIADYPGLELLDIPHLELLASGVSVILFSDVLAVADDVTLETDALATATTLTARAHAPSMRVILDALLAQPAYQAMAPRLRCIHCFGAGNPAADAASRGYHGTLAAIGAALGIEPVRASIPERVHSFLGEALRQLQPLLGSTTRGTHNPNMIGDQPIAESRGSSNTRLRRGAAAAAVAVRGGSHRATLLTLTCILIQVAAAPEPEALQAAVSLHWYDDPALDGDNECTLLRRIAGWAERQSLTELFNVTSYLEPRPVYQDVGFTPEDGDIFDEWLNGGDDGRQEAAWDAAVEMWEKKRDHQAAAERYAHMCPSERELQHHTYSSDGPDYESSLFDGAPGIRELRSLRAARRRRMLQRLYGPAPDERTHFHAQRDHEDDQAGGGGSGTWPLLASLVVSTTAHPAAKHSTPQQPEWVAAHDGARRQRPQMRYDVTPTSQKGLSQAATGLRIGAVAAYDELAEVIRFTCLSSLPAWHAVTLALAAWFNTHTGPERGPPSPPPSPSPSNSPPMSPVRVQQATAAYKPYRAAAQRTPPSPSDARSPASKAPRARRHLPLNHTTAGTSSSPSAPSPPSLRPVVVPSLTVEHRMGGNVVTSSSTSGAVQWHRQNHIDNIFDLLRSDTSEGAIRADDEVLRAMIETSVLGDDTHRPITSTEQFKGRWRKWEEYCAYAGIDTLRPDYASLAPGMAIRERIIWAAALPYVYARMEPAKGRYLDNGQPKPPFPKSALAVLRAIRAEHTRHGIDTPSLKLATTRCHELMLKYRDINGTEALAAKRKSPLTSLIITGILAVPEDAPIMGRGRAWSWGTILGRSVRTLMHVLAQTGFRKAEVATHAKAQWGKKDLSFYHLTWRIQGKDYPSLSRAQYFSLQPGDYAVITPSSSKADQFGLRWGNRPIWLPYDQTAAINAARALADWEMVAGVPDAERRDTPLFWGVVRGTALTQRELTDAFERLLTYVVGKEEAKKYSIHSFRRWLASAMLAAKCSNAQIQAALRWASAEALDLYAVTSEKSYGDWLLAAEQIKLTATMAHHLPRAMPTYDVEDLATALLDDRLQTLAAADAMDRGLDAARGRVLAMGEALDDE